MVQQCLIIKEHGQAVLYIHDRAHLGINEAIEEGPVCQSLGHLRILVL